GMETRNCTKAPTMPASRPTIAPSLGVMASGRPCWSRYAATRPPLTTQKQQQRLPRLTSGSADNTPMTSPPTSAGCSWSGLVVVLTAQVGDQLLALQVAQRVLQLHQLNEQIVLGVQTGGVNRTLEVEGQPLLDAVHAGAPRQVEKERDIEHDWSRENAVATEEIDLQLHRVSQPADQIDVVPPLFVVAARRIIVDPHDVAEVFVEVGVELGLEDVIED